MHTCSHLCIWRTGFRDGTADSGRDPRRFFQTNSYGIACPRPAGPRAPLLMAAARSLAWRALTQVRLHRGIRGCSRCSILGSAHFLKRYFQLPFLYRATSFLEFLSGTFLGFCSLWGPYHHHLATWTIPGQAVGMLLPIFQVGKLSHRDGGVALESRTRTPQVSHLVY